MITDSCPICKTEYHWDACQDIYVGAREETKHYDFTSVQATLHICTHDGCEGIVAVTITDEYGSSVYIPSTKEL